MSNSPRRKAIKRRRYARRHPFRAMERAMLGFAAAFVVSGREFRAAMEALGRALDSWKDRPS